jgi:hypothetical protein
MVGLLSQDPMEQVSECAQVILVLVGTMVGLLFPSSHGTGRRVSSIDLGTRGDDGWIAFPSSHETGRRVSSSDLGTRGDVGCTAVPSSHGTSRQVSSSDLGTRGDNGWTVVPSSMEQVGE